MLFGVLVILSMPLLSFPSIVRVSTHVLVSIIIQQECTIFIILIVFVILAKYYKYCVRENEVNMVQINYDHYQKLKEQEKHYDYDSVQVT